MRVLYTDRIGIWSVGFCAGRKAAEPGEKPSEQDENQQQTQPTYDTGPKLNPGQIGGRRAHSPLRFPCSPVKPFLMIKHFICSFCFQLSVLQARMREALEYFYRLRGLQSKADIAEFELKCIENGDKLVTLQSDMMRVIEHINRFLEANNAAHDVISMEAAKIAQTPTSGTMVA